MLYLTTTGSATGDPVALLMVLALAVIVGVMAVRKLQMKKQAAQTAPAAASAAAPLSAEPPKAAPGSAGRLKIHDVEPKTAAMLMAITADKLGKPLNELRFISIKKVKK